MGVVNYGTGTDPLSSPSLASWAGSVAAALDSSDVTVNTRLNQRKMPITAKTGSYTLTASDEVVTCSGTLTITLPSAVALDGKQFVIRNIATSTVTIARTSSQTVDGVTGTITLAGKGVLVVVSDGANWLVVSGQYTDESIGRRLFTWSSALASGATPGWQLTYSDTGWRDVSADLNTANGFSTGTILVRRQGNSCMLAVTNLTRAASSSSNVVFYTAPSGFRPNISYWIGTSGNIKRVSFEATGNIYILAPGTAADSVGYIYMTTDAWPASLPGSASGSIPAS